MLIKFSIFVWLYLLIVSNILLTAIVCQELRFCYHGPHKIDLRSCRGGILFQKPLPASCIFVGKSSDGKDGRVTVNGDICNPLKAEDVDLTEANPTHTFGITSIQEVLFEDDSDTAATPGVDLAINDVCIDQCFMDWLPLEDLTTRSATDSFVDHDKEPPYSYPRLTPEQKAQQNELSENLFMKLMINADMPVSSMRVIKLLRASFMVMSSYCPAPYISQSMITRIVQAFSFFLEFNKRPVKDIGVREFHEVMDVLAQCRSKDKYSSFELLDNTCTDVPAINGARFWHANGTAFTRTYSPEHKRKMDPFIEAAWNAISFINAQCFFDFGDDNFNLHQIYEVAMESLYSKLVLLRWIDPPALKDPSFWNNLMGTAHFEVELSNIQICNKLAYVRNPYRKRLERPFRKDNGTEGTREEEEVVAGWTKSSAEYWETYASKGGILKVLRKLGGICYKTSDLAEAAREKLKKENYCKINETSSNYPVDAATPKLQLPGVLSDEDFSIVI